MTIVAVHQPQYLPYLGFFNKLANCDVFVALDHTTYDTGGLQNRNKIKASCAGNMQWLTVPVRHSGTEQAIKDVRIDSSQRWRKKHWNLLNANYYHAEYFLPYAEELRAIIDSGHDSLCELNMALVTWCMEALQIHTPIVYSSGLAIKSRKSEMLIEICRSVGADAYLSGPGGANYMELSLFERACIRVLWQKFKCRPYVQQYPETGFVPNLSVIDALLNCGPEVACLATAGVG